MQTVGMASEGGIPAVRQSPMSIVASLQARPQGALVFRNKAPRGTGVCNSDLVLKASILRGLHTLYSPPQLLKLMALGRTWNSFRSIAGQWRPVVQAETYGQEYEQGGHLQVKKNEWLQGPTLHKGMPETPHNCSHVGNHMEIGHWDTGKVLGKSLAGFQPVMGSVDDLHEGALKSDRSVESNLTRHFDFLVIGSGVAGLRYALEVAKFGSVAIVTKSEPHESNTNYAQGGVSAVLDPSDSVESHIQDTIIAGAFLCDEETVEVVCREGPERVRELMAWGALFDQSEDGQLHLAREGGHSHHRIVHAADMTGREIERALLTAARTNPNIVMFEHHFAVDLLTLQEGATVICYGLDALDIRNQKVVRFIAGVTMLASGGAGHIYPTTTNPLVATGDGVALAQRAHAVVSNMEFVQFHPTALADEGLPIRPEKRENAFLITEAMRGAGGILYNQSMERFMPLYDSRAELAPRDMVARSIDDQLKKRNERFVYLDISHKPRDEILSHFPNIAAECLQYGIDITKQPIPVVPAAHYMCGGVQTGLLGETSIVGLFAAGEVTCTGLHGANRLASNSLLEALVFAQRAVGPSVDHALKVGGGQRETDEAKEWPRPVVAVSLMDFQVEEVLRVTALQRKRLQQIMWDYVGIVRSTERLQVAQAELGELEHEWEDHLLRNGWKPSMVSLEVCEMRNLISVANFVVSSALGRQESRGLHYTTDFPELVESERLPTILFPSSPMANTWIGSQLVHKL